MTRPVDRSRPPVAGEPRSFTFPKVERTSVPDGPDLLLLRRSDLPLVCVEMLLPAGAERSDRPGLAPLTGRMLDAGTASSSAEDLARRADALGGSLTTDATWHLGFLTLQTLSRNLETALELIAETLTAATFPEAEVERLRRKQLVEALRRKDRPGTLAIDHLHSVLFGDSPYGAALVGTQESLESLERDHLLDFYRRFYRPAAGTLLLTGDLDPEAAREIVAKFLGGGSEDSRVAAPLPVQALPREGLSFTILDRPGAPQTELRLGHVGPSRVNPDFVPFTVLNTVFGGKFTSRINLNLRERHGFTYGAAARLAARRSPGPWVVSSAISTEAVGASIREIRFEMERLQQEPVSAEELADTVSYAAGTFPYTLQTLDGLSSRLENLVAYDLPDDYYERYPDEIRAVDRTTVQRMARKYFQPDRLAVVAAGPAAVIRPQLEELDLGPVDVVSAESPESPRKPAR